MQSIQDTIARLWHSLTWSQRLTIVGLSVGILGAVYLVLTWASNPSYSILFTNLSTTDAASITQQLTSDKVPYELADSGTTILVPASQVDTERLSMANKGLPTDGTVGFSLFDKQSLLQTDNFTEQIDYTRALEGELTQTINQVAGVQYARVNIVIPQQSLFTDSNTVPTASVLLRTGLGGLTSDQVAGIQHLVASAVQGLTPDNVTVVDGSGNIISGNSSTDVAGTGLTVMQAEARYASNLEAQLSAMLDTILGPDHAVVKVNDVLDFTTHDTTSTTYDPQKANSPLTNSHLDVTNTGGISNTVGGLAGLTGNVPSYGTGNGSTPITDTNLVQDLTYTNSFTTTHVVAAPGTLQALSVAVVVDSNDAPAVSRAELANLTQAVQTAVGYVPGRDTVTLTSAPFNTTAVTQADAAITAQQQQNMMLTVVKWAALIVVPLILLFMLRRLLIPAGLAEYEEEELPETEVIEQRLPMVGARNPLLTLAAPPPSPMRESLTDLAKHKPEVLAGVIGRWIDEDR